MKKGFKENIEKATLNNEVTDGDAVIVPAGAQHNYPIGFSSVVFLCGII